MTCFSNPFGGVWFIIWSPILVQVVVNELCYKPEKIKFEWNLSTVNIVVLQLKNKCIFIDSAYFE